MKKYRAPLPDFKASYTHSCNNLASYEMKRNPDPKKVTQKVTDMKPHPEKFAVAKSGF